MGANQLLLICIGPEEQLALAHFLPHAKHREREAASAPAIISSSGGGKQFGYTRLALPLLYVDADTAKQHNKCV